MDSSVTTYFFPHTIKRRDADNLEVGEKRSNRIELNMGYRRGITTDNNSRGGAGNPF